MKNIFVIGLEGFNTEKLRRIGDPLDYRFHPLLDFADVKQTETFDIDKLLERAEQQLRAFPEPVDGIISYWDFPASLMWPILCRRMGLNSPTLETALRCEHKFYSRTEQQKVIPEHIPKFHVFNPFDDNALSDISLDYPFWVKPVKSFRSYLGFKIHNADEFNQSIVLIREKICRFAIPFNARRLPSAAGLTAIPTPSSAF